MAKLMQLNNKIAIITGAASGIGRATAIALSRKGCHLALADIDQVGLEETSRMAASNETRISLHNLDVSDREAVRAFPGEILKHHESVDILFNNAGVSAAGTFEMVSDEDFEWVVNINFWGVVHMTRAFLPILKKSKEARLVNMSSIFGIIAPPNHTSYCASKFAVRGFSQSLRHELLGSNVGITVIHPGGVATSIADNARIPADATEEQIAEGKAEAKKKLTLSPEAAADRIIDGIERRKPRVIIGNDAKIVSLIERLAPATYWKIIARLGGHKQ